MANEPALLLVALNGKVRSMNETARAFLGDCTGRCCSAALMAGDPDGTRICHSTCATPRGERASEGRVSNGVLIRGEHHRLVCTPMEDCTVPTQRVRAANWAQPPVLRPWPEPCPWD